MAGTKDRFVFKEKLKMTLKNPTKKRVDKYESDKSD